MGSLASLYVPHFLTSDTDCYYKEVQAVIDIPYSWDGAFQGGRKKKAMQMGEKGKWRTKKKLSGTNTCSFDKTQDPFVEQGMARTTNSGLVRKAFG